MHKFSILFCASYKNAPRTEWFEALHFLFSFILCLCGFVLFFNIPSALHGGFTAAAGALCLRRFAAYLFLFNFLNNFFHKLVFSFAHK